MRCLAALALCAAVADGLLAAPPALCGDAGPRATLSPEEAKRLFDPLPTTSGQVPRLGGPTARIRRYVEPPGFGEDRKGSSITRWEYATVDGFITVDFDNTRVISLSESHFKKT